MSMKHNSNSIPQFATEINIPQLCNSIEDLIKKRYKVLVVSDSGRGMSNAGEMFAEGIYNGKKNKLGIKDKS